LSDQNYQAGGNQIRAVLGNVASKLPILIFLFSFVLAIVILYFGHAVLIPIAFSLLLTFLLSPIVDSLERLHLGRVTSVIAVVMWAFSLLAAVGWIVTVQITTLLGELPGYERNIKQKIGDLRQMGKGGTLEQVQRTVEDIKEEIEKDNKPSNDRRPREVVVQAEPSSTFWPVPLVIGPVVERLASTGLAIVLVIFMLIERDELRNRLIRLVGYGRLTITTKALEEAGGRISRYLLMESIINSGFGLAVAIGLFLVGLPYAALWGFLAAVLRFIPYVGPWLAALMPCALALAAFEGWLWPMAVVGLFVALELVANMILEPLLYGDSAGVSQVALLISVAFWTWIWGPIGLLMATPLTVCLVVVGKYVPQLEYLTVLMSDEPVADTHVIYYQRLLAMDRDEAAKIVTDYAKSHPRDEVYDTIMMPALNFARMDSERGSLSEVQEEFIVRESRAIAIGLNEIKEPSTQPVSGTISAQEERAPAGSCLRILGCPARDDLDEVAIVLFQQLLGRTQYRLDVIGDEKLASEVITEIGVQKAAVVCVGVVQPGGLAHARYLCKRLHRTFPDIKIVVGLWGFNENLAAVRDSLSMAGADQVGGSLLESRDQIRTLAPLLSGSGEPT
jgi:predicted PurR-regulated permease PerM